MMLNIELTGKHKASRGETASTIMRWKVVQDAAEREDTHWQYVVGLHCKNSRTILQNSLFVLTVDTERKIGGSMSKRCTTYIQSLKLE